MRAEEIHRRRGSLDIQRLTRENFPTFQEHLERFLVEGSLYRVLSRNGYNERHRLWDEIHADERVVFEELEVESVEREKSWAYLDMLFSTHGGDIFLSDRVTLYWGTDGKDLFYICFRNEDRAYQLPEWLPGDEDLYVALSE